ncbi:MAG: amidohydrolase family protein [Aurantimicrobium sp.]|uniref:amidohydrolase family protein n=1 Tax=Aurantimicrobium sp. TaxID=1930784 RepID=UPI002FCB1F3C
MTLFAPQGIIDSHLHIWELGVSRYEWIKPELGFLYNDFPISEARFELATAGVESAILVQVEDSLADTEYMLSIADSNEWVRGVVGWVDLESPDTVAETLERFGRDSKLVGVRHLIHDDPRQGFLVNGNVQASLRKLANRGLSFDVSDAWPKDLRDVPKLAAELDELRIVIDHLGKPPLDKNEQILWQDSMSKAAAFENVSTKLSGLLNAAENYTPQSLQEVFDFTLNQFGPGRMLFGGDWPVSTINGHYAETAEVLFELISTLSIDEQDSILQANAAAVYALDLMPTVSIHSNEGSK